MKLLKKIPTTIVSGFLGSGKTTLLRNILENANGTRIAVIVNEFGELGIDGDILGQCPLECAEEESEVVFELANGCLCCTVQEEFFPVMQQLVERRDQIDHILIETSGLALPKPLVQAFQWPEIKNACTVDAVITVVDTPAVAANQFAANPSAVDQQRQNDENLDHSSTLHELFEDQLSAADLVILNKCDLANPEEIEQVTECVRKEIPAQVKILPSRHGKLDIRTLLGLESASEESIDSRQVNHSHAEGEDHDHDSFDSITLDIPETDESSLVQALQILVKEFTIYRIKDFVNIADKPMRLVIQGVGARFDRYFDRPWKPQENRESKIVFIGAELDPEQIKARLQTLVSSTA